MVKWWHTVDPKGQSLNVSKQTLRLTYDLLDIKLSLLDIFMQSSPKWSHSMFLTGKLFTGIIRVNKGKSSKETEKSQGVPNKQAADAQ